MQEFTFKGPLRIGDEKIHTIKIQVTAVPDDENDVDLVKQCGVIEDDSIKLIHTNMMLAEMLMRKYYGEKTDTIIDEEAN